MDTTAKPIGQVLRRVTDEARSLASSTTPLKKSTDLTHKRAFVETFRRWEALFKRKDSGDARAEMWLVGEYYDSLKHLSPAGFNALTGRLKATCTFFPTIRECLDAIRPASQYDWGHPFLSAPALFQATAQLATPALPAPSLRIESDDHDR